MKRQIFKLVALLAFGATALTSCTVNRSRYDRYHHRDRDDRNHHYNRYDRDRGYNNGY